MSLWTCCRHCSPGHPAHPAGRDVHETPCGPAWCSESIPVAPQLALDLDHQET